MRYVQHIGEFVATMRKRGAFRAAALYVFVAWIVVQAASIVLPTFGAPNWAMRAVLVVAFAGFPVVIILAWTFEFTARGLSVTLDDEALLGHRRWWFGPLIGASLVAGVVGTATWLWTARLSGQSESSFLSTSTDSGEKVVAVLPLENLTGLSEHRWVGEGIASLVRDDLARSRRLAVVSASRTMRLVSGHFGDRRALIDDAAQTGITHVLSGEILRTPKGLTIASRLTDLRRNVDIGAERQQGLIAEEVVNASVPIAIMVRQSLGLPGTDKIDVFGADFAASNLGAYESFVAGMENFLRFDYDTAKVSFESAVAKAPEFAMARYRLAHTMAVLGDTEGSLKQIAMARRASLRLPELQRMYIEAGEAYIARDAETAERRYRELLARYPYETEARLLLVYLLEDKDLRRALAEAQVLAKQEPDSEVAWGAVAFLAATAGDFDVAEPAIERYLSLAPENPNAHLTQADSLFFQNRLDEARAKYLSTIAKFPYFAPAQLQLGYLESLAHNWDSAIDRFKRVANDSRFSASDRIAAAFEWAELLRADGQCHDVGTVLDGFHNLIVRERIRVALEIDVRARCELVLGNAMRAVELAKLAAGSAIGPATRYLFVQAVAEIESGNLQQAESTIAKIAAIPSQAGADGTVAKTVTFLRARIALARGDARAAEEQLRVSVSAPGKSFDIYELELMRLLVQRGERAAAQALSSSARSARNPRDPRVDLILAQHRLQMLELELRSGRDDVGADKIIAELEARWSGADPRFSPALELTSLRNSRMAHLGTGGSLPGPVPDPPLQPISP